MPQNRVELIGKSMVKTIPEVQMKELMKRWERFHGKGI